MKVIRRLPKNFPGKPKNYLKIPIILLVLLLAGGVGGYFFVARPVLELVGETRELVNRGRQIYSSAKNQDLAAVTTGLPELQSRLLKLEEKLNRLGYLNRVPVLSGYWSDAGHLIQAGLYGTEAAKIVTETLAPYADVLGLKGKGSFSGGTAEDRLQTVVTTLDKVSPSLDLLAEKISLTKKEIERVNPDRYPTKLGGRPVRHQLGELKTQVAGMEELLVKTKPLVQVLPKILGEPEPKKYLVLFQNDTEIRPTGGFLTAYAIFSVAKGKIRAEKSEDIYVLDNSVTKVFPLPEAIKLSPIKVGSWHLRDSNLSPDFVESMKQFEEMYRYASRRDEIDGIMALDTKLLVNVINVLGPVNASGIEFTTATDPACNCPQVIYQLERIVDTPAAFERSGRKDILGVLMLSIMQKGLQSSPSQVWPDMIQTLLISLKEKHLLFYFHDPQIQDAVEKVNYAGRILPADGDYLHINNTNFGGAKSNLFIKEKVLQDFQVDAGGQITKTVTIEYINPQPASNCNLEAGELCLNGIAPLWVRVYVPQGSQLLKASGSTQEVLAEEDLGKTVFAGRFTVRPEGAATFSVTYRLPDKSGKKLPLLIQKQPGQGEITHEIRVNGQLQQTLPVRGDLNLEINF